MSGARCIAELARRLNEDIGRLAPELLPGGVWAAGRRQWRCGSIQGEKGSALRVWLSGPTRGKWRCYASGEHGDALDLVAAVHGGGPPAAIRWAAAWLGGAAAEGEQRRPEREKAERLAAERLLVRQRGDARRVWFAAAALVEGDFGWRYLEGRGIWLDELPRPPAALRCHPALWNVESGRAWPALVAAISGPEGALLNVHRIWLDCRADGRVTKAPLAKPKLSMPGGYAGGCVRLCVGASGKSWRDMPASETLAVGEGVEDALSLATLRPDFRCAAVLSVSGLERLVLPSQVARIVWIAQNDPEGSPAARALDRGLDAHRRAGRRVALVRPPPDFKDLNDFLRSAELSA